jgi:aspartate/methionine/tyrosine aminotransferase
LIRRFQTDLAPNRLANAVRGMLAGRRPFIDLTLSNPTCAGFDYPADLLARLADPRALTYSPQPFGLGLARQAVAADYARRGLPVRSDRIALTASTSEAYSLLFKVLCEPGDEVLVPRPSYPLFEHLTRLEGVVAKPYDLDVHGAWAIDAASVERARSPRTRAALVVSPNNPTGSFVKPGDLDVMAGICADIGAAIIADEVFADYELAEGAAAAAGHVLMREDVLAFGLGGLSKCVGLPQLKLGWIATTGPEAAVARALDRLELVCDTYLSVSTPVQAALPELLQRGAVVREQIRARVGANHQHLLARAAATPSCRVLRAEGGWYAVVQIPTLVSEEELVLDLLSGRGVLVHPGYFFDFPRESYLVVSLLPPADLFADGVARIFGHFDCSRLQP